MAAKKNKAKISPNKRGYDKWQWLNLPPEIIQLLNRYRSLQSERRKDPIQYMGTVNPTTKSWIRATSRCSGRCERRWPQLRLSGISSNTSPMSTRTETFHIIHDVETDYKETRVYNTDENKWINCERRAIDPFGAEDRSIEFTSIVGFQWRYYALSLQGALAVIEGTDSRSTITSTSATRAVPSENSRFFKECLVVIDGEICLVFFIHRKSLEIVDGIEVFRLCLVELKWIRVERLRGKAVFMDERCYWVNSAEIGCRDDCVYFTQGSESSWWLYDMKNCSVSPV